MEYRYGKRIMSHLDKLVEQGALKDKRADLIFQVGSGLFGARKDGKYSEEVFLENAMKPEVKAIELKLAQGRSEEHTSELQSRGHLVCRLLLEKKKKS